MNFFDGKTFLQLAFEAIYAHYGTGYVYEGVNWEYQFQLAHDAKLTALLYPTIERLAKENEISTDLLSRWKLAAEKEQEKAKAKKEALFSFLKKAEQEELSFVLFKGAILADLYPSPLYRPSNDTDVYVDLEEGMDLIHFLERNGYAKDLRCSTTQVPVYCHLENGHRIEIHYSLFEDYTGSKIDLLDSYLTEGKEHFISQKLEDLTVTTLNYQEHLLYQIFHLVKHVLVEGTDFRSIIDILLFLQAYQDKIDFDELWKKLDSLGYGKVSEIIFYCCTRHMHLKSTILDNRILPSTQAQLHLLEELAAFSLRPFPEEYMELACKLTEPFVDGSDATNSPDEIFKENQELYAPIKERMEQKLWNIHELHLTSREFKIPAPMSLHPNLFMSPEQLAVKKQETGYFYRAYGITISCDREMHELFPLEDMFPKADIDVFIHESVAPGSLKNPLVRKVSKDYFWFYTHNARFLCLNGNEIIYEKKKSDEPWEEIKPFIISHCLVNILYMRNIITLHSSTVGNETGAITLLGDCGAGKSTYSTLLRHEGYKLLADDISAIRLEQGIPMVALSVPQQKYKVDTALKEGHKLEDLECIDKVRNKYRLLLSDDEMCDGPKPMKGLFELVADTEHNRLEFQKLEGMDALRMLTCNLFCQNYSDSLGGLSVDTFQSLLQIAKQVPVYRILRPTNRDARQEILDFILEKTK